VTRKPIKPKPGGKATSAKLPASKKVASAQPETTTAFAKARSGPQGYNPAPTDRLFARLGAAAGMTHEQIAKALLIDEKTLLKHFREELHDGAHKAHLQVVGNLFRIATQTQDNKAALTAAIWWTKARLGWRGDNGPPIEASVDAPAGAGPVRFTLKIGERTDASDE
jgi:hypothetical protein